MQSTGGAVTTTWDASTGDLRLNYPHDGLTRVADRRRRLAPAAAPARRQGDRGDVLAAGHRRRPGAGPRHAPAAHRDGSPDGGTLALTGDNGTDPNIEVFTAASTVTWNGRRCARRRRARQPDRHDPDRRAVTLPALTTWKHQEESPEAQPGFDDSSWEVADKTTTNSSSGVGTLPVLYADDYGFHTGNTWYRGRFRATGKETGVHLISDSGGGAQAFSAWLNGTFLGSSTTGSADFTFPAGALSRAVTTCSRC